MTETIKQLVKQAGAIVCPICEGEGEVVYFCGHETTTNCTMCQGDGAVKSLKQEKTSKTCVICQGRGGPGCCDNKGYLEWEIFEPI